MAVLIVALIILSHKAKSAPIALDEWKVFAARIEKAGQFQDALTQATVDEIEAKAKEILPQTTALETESTALGHDFFRYYIGQIQIIAGQKEQGRKAMAALVDNRHVAPEALNGFYLFQSQETIEQRRQYWEISGSLVPLSPNNSTWRPMRIVSTIESPALILADLGWRVENQWLQIPEFLYQERWYEEAIPAYIEAIYKIGHVPFSIVPTTYNKIKIDDTALSAYSAPLWLKVAESQWYLGDYEAMGNSLAKAWIFGKHETRTQAQHMMEKMQQNTLAIENYRADKKNVVPIFADAKPETIRKVAQKYVDLRTHPRAIELLRRYDAIMGDEGKQLQQKYLQEWKGLIGGYCVNVYGPCYFLGEEVKWPDKTYVPIPFPISDDAMKKARLTVDELSKLPAK